MLSKSATGNNGHIPVSPGLLAHIPAALRVEISEALRSEEGQMNEPAADRILRAIAEDHKETRDSIREMDDELHDHHTRLTVMEGSIARAEKSAEDAAKERADTKRLVKGAVIGIGILLAVTGVMGYYGLKAPAPVPAPSVETIRQDAANANDLKELIKEIRQDREDRKNETVPANDPGKHRPHPVPVVKPKGTSLLREGEVIAPSRSPLEGDL